MITPVSGFAEQGRLSRRITFDATGEEEFLEFVHGAYNRTSLELSISCVGEQSAKFSVRYMLRNSPCQKELNKILTSGDVRSYWEHPRTRTQGFTYDHIYLLDGKRADTSKKSCKQHEAWKTEGLGWQLVTYKSVENVEGKTKNKNGKQKSKHASTPTPSSDESDSKTSKPEKDGGKEKKNVKRETQPRAETLNINLPFLTINHTDKHHEDTIAIIPADGMYLLFVSIVLDSAVGSGGNVTIDVTTTWNQPSGYLSPLDYPLLPFHSFLCAVYVLFAVAWLIVCAMRWRELLQVQYWIGGFIFLGMIEQAVFVAEYKAVNSAGVSAMAGTIEVSV